MARSKKAVAVVIAVYAAALAMFRGECWPFSVFPMFSSGPRPWVHAVVRECAEPTPELSDGWLTREELPCAPLPLDSLGLQQNDLSSLVRNVVRGDVSEERIAAYFASFAHHNPWVVYQAAGSLDEHGDPSLHFRMVSVVPTTPDPTTSSYAGASRRHP